MGSGVDGEWVVKEQRNRAVVGTEDGVGGGRECGGGVEREGRKGEGLLL